MPRKVSISREWSLPPGPVVTILKRATCCLLRQFDGTLAQSSAHPTHSSKSGESAMQTPKNVLVIVVDQWRGLMQPKVGADYLKLPNIERLCAEGGTFRNHFTQCAPCGPARASLLTSLYLMNHRAVQNTIPLDSRFTNLAHELRRGGYDAALVGYTTTTPDPRTTGPNDPRFLVLGDVMDGFRPVRAFDPYRDAYFGWMATQGYNLPKNPNATCFPQADT